MERASTAFLLSFGFFAFTCAILLSVVLGLPSRAVSVPYRALFLLVSVAISVWGSLNRRSVPHLWCLLLLLPFWIIVTLRIAYEVFGAGDAGYSEYRELFYQSLLMCFVPMVAFWHTYSLSAYRAGLMALLLFGLVACVLATWLYGGALTIGAGRVSTGDFIGDYLVISPLQLSYLGSAMMVLGMALFLDKGMFKNRMLRLFTPWCVTAAGIPPFLLGASRGSVVAVCGSAFVLLLSRMRVNRIRQVLGLSCLIGLLILVVIHFARVTESTVFTRMGMIAEDIETGASSVARIQIWKESIERFSTSPLWGAALFVEDGGYPHNHVIESLMVTGLIGGIPFTFVVLFGLSRAWIIIRASAPLSWIAVLFIHYFIGGAFSSSVMTHPCLWFSLALVFGASPIAESCRRKSTSETACCVGGVSDTSR